MYVELGMTLSDIATRLGTAKSNVQFWLVEYDIPRRVGSPAKRDRPSHEELLEMSKTRTQREIAEELGVSRPCVSLWLKAARQS